MVDAVQKAKWMTTVAKEMGFGVMGGHMVLGPYSSAAKSFVARRGLGRIRHIEVRDLWLQQEVAKGVVKVVKVPGEENSADLMTKHLHMKEIRRRLAAMDMDWIEGNAVKNQGKQKQEHELSAAVGQEAVDVERVGSSGRGRLVKGRWADEDDDDEEAEITAVWWRETR